MDDGVTGVHGVHGVVVASLAEDEHRLELELVAVPIQLQRMDDRIVHDHLHKQIHNHVIHKHVIVIVGILVHGEAVVRAVVQVLRQGQYIVEEVMDRM